MTAYEAAPATPVRWWLPLIEGILAIVVGLLFFTQPVVTSLGFVLGLGIYWFFLGVIDLVRALLGPHALGLEAVFGHRRHPGRRHDRFRHDGPEPSARHRIRGRLDLYDRGRPDGHHLRIVALVYAFRGGGWWPGVLGGFGILFGLVLLANPLGATLALPWTLGIVLIGVGIMLIVAAFRLR